ncbi:MAG: hypothetical protein AAF990_09790 [Bacteroidota bacterium]
MRALYLLVFCCWISVGYSADGRLSVQGIQADTVLPKAFLIGEHEAAFEKLSIQHSTMLLSACGDDMDAAYGKWWSMIQEMEAYSNLIGYDLKGIRAWLNIFWEKDGRIRHIAYYLKPSSKLVDLQELTAFFTSFMNHYSFPLITDARYSHYGSASFPTSPRRVQAPPKENVTGKPLVKDSSEYKK